MDGIKFLSGAALKLFAMMIMLVDHIGAIFFPELIWVRIIGRLAFPIFAFFIAEGFAYTKNVKKYIVRMAVFAIITELIYDVAFHGAVTWEYQNVMVTFLIALIGLYGTQKLDKYVGCAVMIALGMLAEVMKTDYGCFGVLLVYIYHLMRNGFWTKHFAAALFMILGSSYIQPFAAISTIPLMFYNGKKGINLKFLFYAFYPAHLLILFLIKYFVI